MIDKHNIDKLEESEKLAVETAIITIYNSGLLQLQLKQRFEALLSGDQNQAKEDLADDILAYRKDTQGLKAFENLGRSLMEEKRSA